MATDVLALTGYVVTVNVTLVWPAGIVTLNGTEAADGLLLKSEIGIPLVGAAEASARSTKERTKSISRVSGTSQLTI